MVLHRRSSCLLFQLFSVEARSFLPNDQSDCGNLTRQCQTRHLRLDPFGNQSCVKLLEGLLDSSGPKSRALKEIFQIVVMVFVEPANGYRFLGTLELSVHHAVFRTGTGLQSQAAVAPQLSFGTETVRCLDEREQKHGADGTDEGI